jgi:hypothetical protein
MQKHGAVLCVCVRASAVATVSDSYSTLGHQSIVPLLCLIILDKMPLSGTPCYSYHVTTIDSCTVMWVFCHQPLQVHCSIPRLPKWNTTMWYTNGVQTTIMVNRPCGAAAECVVQHAEILSILLSPSSRPRTALCCHIAAAGWLPELLHCINDKCNRHCSSAA